MPEITPEMVEAGAWALASLVEEGRAPTDDERDAARQIIAAALAMVEDDPS